jgi:glycosyltransferase involved in cell wall biosynthesis
MRVAHVTSGLGGGGAESQLLDLARLLRSKGFDQLVISLLPGGVFADRLQAAGIRVETAGLTSAWEAPRSAIALRRRLNAFRPHVIHGWMYHGNAMASLASAMTSRAKRVLWCLHAVEMDFSDYPLGTRAAVIAGAALSRLPGAVVANSEMTMAYHQGLGFRPRRWQIVHNGTDTERFIPDEAARASLRSELGLPVTAPLIGFYQRYHPVKDHSMFFAMANSVAQRNPDVHFILAGHNINYQNTQLIAQIPGGALARRVHFLGLRSDMERLNAALDLAVVTSRSPESFSNATAEAMSAGVPCVVTEAGFLPELVADTGATVPIGNADLFAEAVLRLLGQPSEEFRELGHRARQRIVDSFSLQGMGDQYIGLYGDLASSSTVLDK